MPDQTFGYGQLGPWDTTSDFNTISFIIRQMMARMSTMKLVKVMAVHAGSGDPPAGGTVDVLPLVNQIDGNNNSTPHGTVYGLPFWRLQAGPWAIIADPAVDDVGYVVVSDRDISSVKSSGGKQSNPGSFRKFDLADGVYIGGLLNAAPTRYIQLKSDGSLKIVDGHGNVLETSASGFALTGNVAVTGTITATGEITRGLGTGDQVTLGHHIHGGVATGPASSAIPTPGT